MSLVQASINTAVSYPLTVAVPLACLRCSHLPARLNAAPGIGAIFTVISIVRSYLLRRLFERVRHVRS